MKYPDKNVTFCRQEIWVPSMRSRRLEVGAQERTSARGRHACLPPFRAPVLSWACYAGYWVPD